MASPNRLCRHLRLLREGHAMNPPAYGRPRWLCELVYAALGLAFAVTAALATPEPDRRVY